jgi:hypothetical protein
VFFIFSPNGAGDFSFPLLKYTHRTVVQPGCISLQNFAICEIADRLQSPTARLGCSFICITSDFAQKKDTNPVGGRGISAFSENFFFPETFLRYIFSEVKKFTRARSHKRYRARMRAIGEQIKR